jgi:hypothetical protein
LLPLSWFVLFDNKERGFISMRIKRRVELSIK